MNRNLVETVLGAMVLGVALLFGYFVYTAAEIRTAPGYDVGAIFLPLASWPPAAMCGSMASRWALSATAISIPTPLKPSST